MREVGKARKSMERENQNGEEILSQIIRLNGQVYEGDFYEDERDGEGHLMKYDLRLKVLYCCSKKEEYRGQFLNNKYDGFGELTK